MIEDEINKYIERKRKRYNGNFDSFAISEERFEKLYGEKIRRYKKYGI